MLDLSSKYDLVLLQKGNNIMTERPPQLSYTPEELAEIVSSLLISNEAWILPEGDDIVVMRDGLAHPLDPKALPHE